jgi:hypothetical protein
MAFAAIKAGIYEIALVVGTEKMNYPDRRKEMFDAFKGSWDRETEKTLTPGWRRCSPWGMVWSCPLKRLSTSLSGRSSWISTLHRPVFI